VLPVFRFTASDFKDYGIGMRCFFAS